MRLKWLQYVKPNHVVTPAFELVKESVSEHFPIKIAPIGSSPPFTPTQPSPIKGEGFKSVALSSPSPLMGEGWVGVRGGDGLIRLLLIGKRGQTCSR